MSEFEKKENGLSDDEQLPENTAENTSENAPERTSDQLSSQEEMSAGHGGGTEEEPSHENVTPSFVWDGRKQGNHRGGKKAAVFCAVAVICLLLTVAICIPTILYAAYGDYSRTGSTTDTSASTSGSTVDQSGESSHYEVSQTVQGSANEYLEDSTLTQVYQKCSPSCVTIYVTYGNQYNGYAIGSGFVLTEDGYIATNQHVVEDGQNFTVIFYDGTEYTAELIGSDSTRDLAVLKIDATGLHPLEIGDSSALSIGQTVIAIGTPYDRVLAGTMTMGIISGVDREIEITDDYGRVTKTMTLIQTDTSINPGNSGGPLINLAGQVVGINSLKLTDEYEGIGFAIPINYAVEIFNQLIQYGRVVQEPDNSYVSANARLGVTVYNLDAGLNAFRIRPQCEYPEEGILVASVEPSTSVYESGLQQYDIITEFDGQAITCVQDLTDALANHKAGDTVTMKVFAFSRNFSSGEYKTLTFVLDSAA